MGNMIYMYIKGWMRFKEVQNLVCSKVTKPNILMVHTLTRHNFLAKLRCPQRDCL